jgi:hypothetical protein
MDLAFPSLCHPLIYSILYSNPRKRYLHEYSDKMYALFKFLLFLILAVHMSEAKKQKDGRLCKMGFGSALHSHDYFMHSSSKFHVFCDVRD